MALASEPMGVLRNVTPKGSESNAASLSPPSHLKELRRGLAGSSDAIGKCVYEVRRLLSDVSREPGNFKFRSLARDSLVAKTILAVRGAEDLLKGMGFEDKGNVLVLAPCVTQGRIDVVLRLLA